MFGEERIRIDTTLREVKQTKLQKAKKIGIFGLYMLFGAAFGFLYVIVLEAAEREHTISGVAVAVLFLACIVVFTILHIALHELGHVIMGKLTGYGFYSYRIFSLMFLKEDGKWKCKKYTLPGTAGQAIMTVPEKKDGKFPWFWYNVGGGLMNIVLSLIVLVLYVLLPIESELVSVIYLTFLLPGFLLGITNLIPNPGGTIPNDGNNMVAMYKDECARECAYRQLETVARLAKNEEFHNQPLEYYQLPEDANLKYALIAVLKTHELEYYYDVEDYSSAIHLLNELEGDTRMTNYIKLNLDTERLFIECMQGPREEVVNVLCTKNLLNTLKASKNMPEIQRIQMAYEGLYANNYVEAEKCYERASKLLDKYPLKGIEVVERRLLEMVKQRMESMLLEEQVEEQVEEQE